jgi:hypothetical protein
MQGIRDPLLRAVDAIGTTRREIVAGDEKGRQGTGDGREDHREDDPALQRL